MFTAGSKGRVPVYCYGAITEIIELLLIFAHCWVQRLVPVYCYGAIIEIIVDICSWLGPEACPCLFLWCHDVYKYIVVLSALGIVYVARADYENPSSSGGRGGGGGGVWVGGGVGGGGGSVANVVGGGDGGRRLILFQKCHSNLKGKHVRVCVGLFQSLSYMDEGRTHFYSQRDGVGVADELCLPSLCLCLASQSLASVVENMVRFIDSQVIYFSNGVKKRAWLVCLPPPPPPLFFFFPPPPPLFFS